MATECETEKQLRKIKKRKIDEKKAMSASQLIHRRKTGGMGYKRKEFGHAILQKRVK